MKNNNCVHVNKKRLDDVVLKLHPIDLFFLFYSILLGARSTMFTSNLDPRENLIGFFLAIVPSLFSYYHHKLFLNNKIKYVFVVITLWIGIQMILNQPFKYLMYGLFLWNIFAAYVLVNVFRVRLFYYFERYTVVLSVVSLVMWILMHVLGPEFMASFSLFEPASGTSAGSFLLFNIPDINYYEGTGLLGFHRNCGFCWEPGMFACFLVLAIFFNLIRTKNQIWGNNNLWILFFALITTFSTTGYVALLSIVFTHFTFGRIKFSGRNIAVLCILALATFYVFQLPFMKDKILDRSNKESFVTENVNAMNTVADVKEFKTVDRFEGMALDLLNIQDKPIFGYGLSRETSFVYHHISPYLLISNGTTTLFASFGTFLSLIMIIALIICSSYMAKISKISGKSFVVLYVVISVSYSFATLAIFIAMAYYYLFSLRTIRFYPLPFMQKKKHMKKIN